jgi:Ca2+/Na+ antiporter
MKYSPTINSDIVVLLLATALILFSLMTGKAKNQIGKPTGILFLTAYVGYLVFVVMRG